MKGRKIRLAISAKPTSSIREQLRYPHFSLGQVSGYIGMNLQFHQLTYEQFLAGELETILTTTDESERYGRIELLHRISLWQLRTNVSWLQIRNTYTHILRKIENKEITWEADWDRYERHIYDKIIGGTVKQKEMPKNTKPSTGTKIETTWFCKMYQKQEGCPKDTPHAGKVGNVYRQLHHICAMCWIKEKVKRFHPEISPDFPQKDA